MKEFCFYIYQIYYITLHFCTYKHAIYIHPLHQKKNYLVNERKWALEEKKKFYLHFIECIFLLFLFAKRKKKHIERTLI